jgi:carboxymethylenebutenolidase
MTATVRPQLAPLALSMALASGAVAAEPETVHFPSADGRTELAGYLFRPAKDANRGAVVMLHGRSGPYRSTVKDACTLVARGVESPCNASTLSGRHAQWGEFWAARGYLALHVDSFGPRGKGHGFGRFTHGSPEREDVNERTVRPLDAEGALAWLRKRDDVAADRIFLQGWSNGGSTTLNVMHRQMAGAPGFRAALSFYPGCGPRALIDTRLSVGAPLTVFLGSADEEVSPKTCREVLEGAKSRGANVEIVWYEGAVHDFDNPLPARQADVANRAARDDSMRRSETFLSTFLTR